MGVGARIRYTFAGIGFLFVSLLSLILSKWIALFFLAIALWCFWGAFNWKKKRIIVEHKSK